MLFVQREAKKYSKFFLKKLANIYNCYVSQVLRYDVSIADVYYTDNLEKHECPNGFEKNAGLIKLKTGMDSEDKSRDWMIEKEARLRVTLRPIGMENRLNKTTLQIEQPSPSFKYIYVTIPKIKRIAVCQNIPQNEKEKIIRVLNKCNLISITDF